MTRHPTAFLPSLIRRRGASARRPTHGFPPEAVPDALHFAAAACHNCGGALSTRFCGACGQEKAARFGPRAVGGEAWQAWRWFDLELLRAAWRLVAAPGLVAREYVLGARKRHVHPLKLLLFASGVLLLVLTRSQGLETQQAIASRAMELLRGWSNWSFSLGVPATFAATWCLFRRYRGYNATEHLVLATYAQFLVLCASSLNRLPTLAWRTPEFLAAHKAWSPWFMDAVGVAVLSLACRQFFRLELRRDGVRLLAACALFLALKWLLQRGYAWLLVRLVLAP